MQHRSDLSAAAPRIIVETRNVYGTAKTYPVCARARQFAALAGTKTLTDHALEEIRGLGFLVIDRTGIAAQVARSLTAAA